MSVSDPKRIIDGFSSIRRGCHSGLSPNQLDRDQLSFAVNTALRTGIPKQRPAIRCRPLVFPDEPTQTAFETGFWQGGFAYRWAGTTRLIVSISGRFYVIDPTFFTVQDLTPATASQPWSPHVWMEQAEMFVIRQDGGLSIPLIYDGASVRESNIAAGEVPGGGVMKYALGRLWLTAPNKRDFIAGDLVFGPSGTAPYGYRDSVLKFTENDFLNEGGAFTVGDEITAMRSQATIDTTLGQGPLTVFYRSGAALVNAPFDRTLWKATTYPIQTQGLISHGALSQWSTLNINNDIWYRADDGIRSIKAARRDTDSWGDTPMSYEMDRVIKFDQTDLLDYSSAVLFDNRLLVTASPTIEPLRGVTHRGIIALDFQQTSSISADTPSTLAGSQDPAYDGLWTGLRILFVTTLTVADTNRCFIWAINSDDKIALYELTTGDYYDGDGTQAVTWSVETPSYRFGFDGISRDLMRLMGATLYRSDLHGPVSFTISYRADRYPVWNLWQAWNDCATTQCVPTVPGCSLLPNQPQYRPPKLLRQPDDSCEVGGSDKIQRIGYEFQAKLEMTGPAQLDLFRLWAYDFPEPRYQECVVNAECKTFRACTGTLFEYEITESCSSSIAGETPEPPPPPPVPPEPPPPDFPQPLWPDVPQEPPGWPPSPVPPPLDTLPVQPPAWPAPPPAIVPDFAPPLYIPVLGCAQVDGWTWNPQNGSGISRPVRFPSALNQANDPNTTFDAALIDWWKAHLQADFLSYMMENSIAFSSYQFYWNWSAGIDAWDIAVLNTFDSYSLYASPGWELTITYCP